MKNETFIGIDFGTTNTAVVRIQNDEYGQRIEPLGEGGEYPFSSIVAIPKDGSNKLRFGRDVRDKRLELTQTHEIYHSMKSYLGTDKEFFVGGLRYSATDITASFLKYIKLFIKKHHGFEITKAAFSFPVDFSPEARRELKKAADSAGIQPTTFVGEATAAYISSRQEAKAYSKVMVLDWGGGTLDTCVLDLKKNSLFETSVWGEEVGGDDIDLELAKRVHAKIATNSNLDNKKHFDDMASSERDAIISYCEKAKIEFSMYDDDYSLTVRNYGDFGTKTITLTYDFFKDIVRSIIETKVFRLIDTALARAGVNKSSIDAVILVGGSTNIRPFINAISNIFGEEKIIMPQKAQWAVATGAALMEIIGNHFYLNDTLGVLLSDNTVYPIFEKEKHGINTEIPAITFGLTEDEQDAHFIFVNEDCSYTYDKAHIETKGYLKEKLQLSAKIDEDQIAKITLSNAAMGGDCKKEIEINKLTFYYDLSQIN